MLSFFSFHIRDKVKHELNDMNKNKRTITLINLIAIDFPTVVSFTPQVFFFILYEPIVNDTGTG